MRINPYEEFKDEWKLLTTDEKVDKLARVLGLIDEK